MVKLKYRNCGFVSNLRKHNILCLCFRSYFTYISSKAKYHWAFDWDNQSFRNFWNYYRYQTDIWNLSQPRLCCQTVCPKNAALRKSKGRIHSPRITLRGCDIIQISKKDYAVFWFENILVSQMISAFIQNCLF